MDYIVIVTKKGIIIKFPASQVKAQSRTGKGIKAIKLDEGDEVAASFVMTELETTDTLLDKAEETVNKVVEAKKAEVEGVPDVPGVTS